jgi:hypothetical protein
VREGEGEGEWGGGGRGRQESNLELQYNKIAAIPAPPEVAEAFNTKTKLRNKCLLRHKCHHELTGTGVSGRNCSPLVALGIGTAKGVGSPLNSTLGDRSKFRAMGVLKEGMVWKRGACRVGIDVEASGVRAPAFGEKKASGTSGLGMLVDLWVTQVGLIFAPICGGVLGGALTVSACLRLRVDHAADRTGKRTCRALLWAGERTSLLACVGSRTSFSLSTSFWRRFLSRASISAMDLM